MDTAGILSAAIAHHRRGETAEAELLYREILSAEPDHVQALHFLGLAAGQRGDLERAIALYRRAAVHGTGGGMLHVNLGKALAGTGRDREAEESYRQAIATDPARAEAHADLGVLRQRAGDLPGAVACYREALRLDASPSLLRYHLATALRRLGSLEEAIEHAGQVVREVPGAPAPTLLLAELRLEAGEAGVALQDCERCLKHEARNRRAIALQAIALARIGEHRQSRSLLDLDRLVRLRQMDPPAPYPDVAALDAALLRAVPEQAGDNADAPGADTGPPRPTRSAECLRGAGGVPGALAARLAEAVRWYLEHRPRDLRHPFLKWRPRAFHVAGHALHLPGAARLEPEIRERGWVSGLYAVAPDPGASSPAVVEVGVPPPRYAGGVRFERREIALRRGRLVLFPSYLFHAVRAADPPERQVVIAFDAVPD